VGLKANLSAVKTTDFFSPVKRPVNSVLSKKKLRSIGLSIPIWQDALLRYLEERKHKA
jgi:dTDP-4-dehydrorhamnose reductase